MKHRRLSSVVGLGAKEPALCFQVGFRFLKEHTPASPVQQSKLISKSRVSGKQVWVWHRKLTFKGRHAKNKCTMHTHTHKSFAVLSVVHEIPALISRWASRLAHTEDLPPQSCFNKSLWWLPPYWKALLSF